MKTNEKKELTLEYVISLMEEKYELTYVDYRDNLDEHLDLIQQCMDKGEIYPLTETVYDWYFESHWEGERYALEQLKEKVLKLGYDPMEVDCFFEKFDCHLRDELCARDNLDVLDELIGNTTDIPVRISLCADESEAFDSIGSHWYEHASGYGYNGYFKSMVDALNLNPAKVKAYMKERGEDMCGRFPNKKNRDGHERVSYAAFYNELLNACCEVNRLTFLATISAKEALEFGRKMSTVTIPAGNYCGLFSAWQGGGSLLDMELKEDIRIELGDKWKFRLDNKRSQWDYSVEEVYGVCSDFFGKNLKDVA